MTMQNLMNNMNYNLKARNNTDKSLLGEIQVSIIDTFFNSGNVTEEAMEQIEANLIGDSKIFNGEESRYSSVNAVYEYYKAQKENYLTNVNSMGGRTR